MTDKLDQLAIEVGKVQQRSFGMSQIRNVEVMQGVVVESVDVASRRQPNPKVLRAIFNRIAEWEEEKKEKAVS